MAKQKVQFSVFTKTDVKGKKANPVFSFLNEMTGKVDKLVYLFIC